MNTQNAVVCNHAGTTTMCGHCIAASPHEQGTIERCPAILEDSETPFEEPAVVIHMRPKRMAFIRHDIISAVMKSRAIGNLAI